MMLSNWAIVAVIAIIVWGVVQFSKARARTVRDEDGKQFHVSQDESPSKAEIAETRREIEALRERLHVLERIATEENSLDARERERIAAEIESLRIPEAKETDSK